VRTLPGRLERGGITAHPAKRRFLPAPTNATGYVTPRERT
jgi:hypothetical protein